MCSLLGDSEMRRADVEDYALRDTNSTASRQHAPAAESADKQQCDEEIQQLRRQPVNPGPAATSSHRQTAQEDLKYKFKKLKATDYLSKGGSSGASGSHVVWKRADEPSDTGSSGSKNGSSGSSHLITAARIDDLEVRNDSSSRDSSGKQHKEGDSGSSLQNEEDFDEDMPEGTDEVSSMAFPGERESLQGRRELEKLQEMSHEQLLSLVPYNSHGDPTSIGPTSIGSMGHDFDQCQPCAFMNRKVGCKQGIHCGFCHFPHDAVKPKKKNRPRPCKVQRKRYERTIENLKSRVEENPQNFNIDKVKFPPSIELNADKKEKAKATLKEHRLQVMALNVVDAHLQEIDASSKMSL